MKTNMIISILISIFLFGCQSSLNNKKIKRYYPYPNKIERQTYHNEISRNNYHSKLLKACQGVWIVGHRMKNHELMLRKKLCASGIQIERKGRNLHLLFDTDITFDVDSAEISTQFKPYFKKLANIMIEFNKNNLIINGYTDSSGTNQYNDILSIDRANSVMRELNNQGLTHRRMFSNGYGEFYPLCSNRTIKGKMCNRRVELIIFPQY